MKWFLPVGRVRLLIAIAAFMWTTHANAGVCKGETPCKACANCSACKYCNSGKGSCSVKRDEEDRRYIARKQATPTPPPHR